MSATTWFRAAAIAALAACGPGHEDGAPGGTVELVAGDSEAGYADGSAQEARFYLPGGIGVDASGVLYVADNQNDRIREVLPDGTVSTVAGSGEAGLVDGPATEARFLSPTSVALDGAGALFVSEWDNHAIRRVDLTARVVSTVAGGADSGFVDGRIGEARFHMPAAVVVAPGGGMIYVADSRNNAIRLIDLDAGEVTTVAGNGEAGFVDGPGGRDGPARLFSPLGLALAADGTLYVGDTQNDCVRVISPGGEVSTLAGTDSPGYQEGDGSHARFELPTGIALDGDGTLYVADRGNEVVRAVSPSGETLLVAGRPDVRGGDNGPAAEATFLAPNSVAVGPSGEIYVADQNRIRVIKRE
jgi:DNA-binding beta-propeller fold protein YncE